MATKMEISLLMTMIWFGAIISCCMAQTFQYSRGWVNGKRSGPMVSGSKPSEHPVTITDDVPEMCKQFLLSEILARSNPIPMHEYAPIPQQLHSSAFYQRPQIKHDAELIVSAPYGFIETPSALNAFDLNDRYKREVKKHI